MIEEALTKTSMKYEKLEILCKFDREKDVRNISDRYRKVRENTIGRRIL